MSRIQGSSIGKVIWCNEGDYHSLVQNCQSFKSNMLRRVRRIYGYVELVIELVLVDISKNFYV